MHEKKEKYPLELPFNETKILLHSCCAPCSCSIMETLKQNNILCTVFFYNPNIDTEKEYRHRKEENMRFAQKLNMPFFDGDYLIDRIKWQQYIKGYENEPERGRRCSRCFEMRLLATAEFAQNHKFRVFTSSLGISRWKNFEEVTKCGKHAADKFENLIYWDYNWRKKGGSNRMSELTKTEKFYQQRYCGCEFSKL